MKLANVTRAFMRLVMKLHRRALVTDCNCADRVSERKFQRAAYQLELVRSAQAELASVQEQALEAQADASKAWKLAADELDALKIGGTRG